MQNVVPSVIFLNERRVMVAGFSSSLQFVIQLVPPLLQFEDLYMADGQGVQSVMENQLFPVQHTWSGVVVGGWGMQEQQNRRSCA